MPRLSLATVGIWTVLGCAAALAQTALPGPAEPAEVAPAPPPAAAPTEPLTTPEPSTAASEQPSAAAPVPPPATAPVDPPVGPTPAPVEVMPTPPTSTQLRSRQLPLRPYLRHRRRVSRPPLLPGQVDPAQRRNLPSLTLKRH